MTDGQLDGVRLGLDEGGDGFADIFDAGKEPKFVKKAMIHGDIEAAVRFRVKEAFEPGGFHGVFEVVSDWM